MTISSYQEFECGSVSPRLYEDSSLWNPEGFEAVIKHRFGINSFYGTWCSQCCGGGSGAPVRKSVSAQRSGSDSEGTGAGATGWRGRRAMAAFRQRLLAAHANRSHVAALYRGRTAADKGDGGRRVADSGGSEFPRARGALESFVSRMRTAKVRRRRRERRGRGAGPSQARETEASEEGARKSMEDGQTRFHARRPRDHFESRDPESGDHSESDLRVLGL